MRHLERDHLRGLEILRRERLAAQALEDVALRPAGELTTAVSHGSPVVRSLVVDGGGQSEDGCRIVGTAPSETLLVAVVPAPRDDGRTQLAAQRVPRVQKRRALWRAKPLVPVACITVRAEVVERKRDLAWRVSSVDDAEEALLARAAAQLLRRQDERRLGRHVAEEEHPGTRRHCAPDGLQELFGIRRR